MRLPVLSKIFLLENPTIAPVKDLLVYKLPSQFEIPRNMQLLLNKAKGSITIRPLKRKKSGLQNSIFYEKFLMMHGLITGDFVPFTV